MRAIERPDRARVMSYGSNFYILPTEILNFNVLFNCTVNWLDVAGIEVPLTAAHYVRIMMLIMSVRRDAYLL